MAASTVVPSAEDAGGEEALERLRSADPLLYLSPSPELSRLAREASRHLFSSLLPFCPKPPPLDRLLAGDDFDAEQIWGQIDQMSRPLVSVLRRELKRLEREPPAPMPDVPAPGAGAAETEKGGDSEEEDEEEAAAEEDDNDEEEDEEEEEEEEEEEAEADGEKGSGVEDRFLKIKELEEYLERDEAKEYGLPERSGRREEKEDDAEEEEEDEEQDEEEEDEEDLEFGSLDGDGNEETDFAESARYEDFFGSKKKRGALKNNDKKEKGSSKKVKFVDGLEGSEMDDEEKDDKDVNAQDKVLSTHEKELQKLHSKIEQMEKENLEPKSWTMQGEVTAVKRPKNSALEVDLDFEHNMRPAPVITEEVTASLEDIIRKRINEEHFDDVQKAPALPSKAPKELKELDENKSKKGLAEIYEEEYAHKAGVASAPLSSSDEQKKEATVLFKKLCLKLDALSHFHFAPKPVIEDMSIQANVPALAMEEIAPLAVSDAAMLAPEEIFEGKGDTKEETELTQAERKRRRANKKRKYKAEEAKRAAKKARVNAAPGHPSAGVAKRAGRKSGLRAAPGHPPNGKESWSHNKS